LSYSLASALFYCGFKEAAENLASQAKFFACMHFDEQITGIRNLMLNLVPEIGQPTLYGIKRHNHKKDKAYLSWESLFEELVPYPGILVETYYVRPVTLHWSHPSREQVDDFASRIQRHKNHLIRLDEGGVRKKKTTKRNERKKRQKRNKA